MDQPRSSLLIGLFYLAACIGGPIAEAAPFWTEKATFVEGGRIYVVGVSTKAKTREIGRKLASENAETELRTLLHAQDLSGLVLQTQMTHEESGDDGSISVYRLMWVSADVVQRLENRGIPRAEAVKCIGAYAGRWKGETLQDSIEFREDCKFVYQGPNCTSIGTYPGTVTEAGSTPIEVKTVTGIGCLPEGAYQCRYIFSKDKLSFDCGVGQTVYRRARSVHENNRPKNQLRR